MRGGVVNVETSGTAAKAVTAITTGNGEYDTDEQDVKGAAGLKADSAIVVNGGTLACMSTGKGGKGISGDQTLEVNDGNVRVTSAGSTAATVSSLASPYSTCGSSTGGMGGGGMPSGGGRGGR